MIRTVLVGGRSCDPSRIAGLNVCGTTSLSRGPVECLARGAARPSIPPPAANAAAESSAPEDVEPGRLLSVALTEHSETPVPVPTEAEKLADTRELPEDDIFAMLRVLGLPLQDEHAGWGPGSDEYDSSSDSALEAESSEG